MQNDDIVTLGFALTEAIHAAICAQLRKSRSDLTDILASYFLNAQKEKDLLMFMSGLEYITFICIKRSPRVRSFKTKFSPQQEADFHNWMRHTRTSLDEYKHTLFNLDYVKSMIGYDVLHKRFFPTVHTSGDMHNRLPIISDFSFNCLLNSSIEKAKKRSQNG